MELLQEFFAREAPRMTALADQIWSLAELRYAETASAQLHIDALAAAGFRITRNVADIPTAFLAEWGEAGPVIAFLGEYDALSGLNQQSGALVCTPSVDSPGAAGHGCGHHLLGTSAHFAAVALQAHLRASGQKARVRYYGCPAEEGGSGKTFMARAGVFDDVDVALTWHPASHSGVFGESTLANIQAKFVFHGKASHAAHSPHLGRSALDAVELMNVGWNFRREHLRTQQRSHYVVTAGGDQPNVVPPMASVWYYFRETDYAVVKQLWDIGTRIAEGAAMMTDTRLERMRVLGAAWPQHMNRPVAEAMTANIKAVGLPAWSEADQALAMIAATAKPAAETEACLDAAYLGAPRAVEVVGYLAGMPIPGEPPEPAEGEKRKLPPPPKPEQGGASPCWKPQ